MSVSSRSVESSARTYAAARSPIRRTADGLVSQARSTSSAARANPTTSQDSTGRLNSGRKNYLPPRPW
jgi:hypothetical protein